MKHIYVGFSKRVWCGQKNAGGAPLTEGEYIDGYYRDSMCPGCVKAIEPVRGRPVNPNPPQINTSLD